MMKKRSLIVGMAIFLTSLGGLLSVFFCLPPIKIATFYIPEPETVYMETVPLDFYIIHTAGSDLIFRAFKNQKEILAFQISDKKPFLYEFDYGYLKNKEIIIIYWEKSYLELIKILFLLALISALITLIK